MPEGRPAISAEVVREIMIEAGHRCAVDGTRFPLEKAHIVAWNESKDHTAENLIVLCANCHEMFDLGKIDALTMREYKKKPWVWRYNNGTAHVEARETMKAQMTLDVKLQDFNEQQGRLLQYALASFLNISPSDVRVGPPEESNSIKVTVELPSSEMKRLLAAFVGGDPDLYEYLAPFVVRDLRAVQSQVRTANTISPQAKRKTKLFVGNLSYESTAGDLAALFKKVGQVESVDVITDRDTGRSKGFGFIEMSAEDADRAIKAFNGADFYGRSLSVTPAPPQEKGKAKLFVGNLSYETTESDLVALFNEVGNVDSARLITDRDTGRSKGFAFIEMSGEDDVNRAITQLDGVEKDGRSLTVTPLRQRDDRLGNVGGKPRTGN